jgi:hypothetical protein
VPDARAALRAGESAALLMAIMAGGSLVLWVGVPLAWLWVASQVQAAAGSLALALAIALVGVLGSIAAGVAVLGWLSERHRAARIARGRDDLGHFPLEVVMVCSAIAAVVLFTLWFFVLSGASPVPLGIEL